MRQFGVVVLAAGNSSRLGRPKQLLEFQGRTLVEHACDAAAGSGAERVCLVLGANAHAISPCLGKQAVEIMVNEDWQSGMSSSLRMGLGRMGDMDATAFMLVDQPLVSAAHLRSLVEALNSDMPIVASQYQNCPAGVPAAFLESEYAALEGLRGDSGARDLIRSAGVKLATVALASSIDVDTESDYQGLLRLGVN